MYRTLPDYICKDTTSGRGDLHTLVQDGSLSSFLVHFGSRWYSSACVILAAGRSQEWWLSASYMILAYVIYDTCLRHIWYLPASYMMHSHAMLSVGWGPICLLQAPYMPISETIFPGVATLSGSGGFLCYHLGEKQLPSRRMGVAEATFLARGWMLSAW